MIKNILLIIPLIITVFTYLRILILKISNKNNHIEKYSSFDLSKELTSNYDEINIIESKEIYLSKYNLKRRVIKLTPKTYNATDYYNLSISGILSGYSLININKDKYLRTLSYIFKNINYLTKSIILSLIISIFTNTIGDAKFSLILLSIITIYEYFLVNINESAKNNIKEELKKVIKKEEYQSITKIINTLIQANTIFFITNLILILRLILMILKM